VSVWSHRARETTAHPDRKLQQTIIQCIVHILVRAEHAGTLVHYPTCVDALAPVWEDDYGSISGPSVYRGYSIYTDQASHRAETYAQLCRHRLRTEDGRQRAAGPAASTVPVHAASTD